MASPDPDLGSNVSLPSLATQSQSNDTQALTLKSLQQALSMMPGCSSTIKQGRAKPGASAFIYRLFSVRYMQFILKLFNFAKSGYV